VFGGFPGLYPASRFSSDDIEALGRLNIFDTSTAEPDIWNQMSNFFLCFYSRQVPVTRVPRSLYRIADDRRDHVQLDKAKFRATVPG
jgi:hypothetical protein